MSDLIRMAETLFEERRLGWMKRDVSYFAPGMEGETVAAHAYFTAQVAFFLTDVQKMIDADGEGFHFDPTRVVMLALFHDSPETRTGDIPRTNSRYVFKDDAKALAEKFGGWMPGEAIKTLVEEFEAGKTMEAQLAQDADVISFLVSLFLLEPLGVQGVQERFEKNFARLKTEAGRVLAMRLRGTKYMDWWQKARWGK